LLGLRLWEGDLFNWLRLVIAMVHRLWLWGVVICWLRLIVLHGFGLWSVVVSWLWHWLLMMATMVLDWLRLRTVVPFVVVMHSLRKRSIVRLSDVLLEQVIVVVPVSVLMAWLSMRWIGEVIIDDVIEMTVRRIVAWIAGRGIVGIVLLGGKVEGWRDVAPIEGEVFVSLAVQVIVQVLVSICFDNGGVGCSNRK